MRVSSFFRSGLGLLAGALLSAATSWAMTVNPPTFPQLVQQAETVARVEITGQTSQWDVTPTGQKVIHTYVQCRVLKEFKGAPQTTLSLRFLGGEVGGQGMEIADMPKFVTGQSYIVFVAENGRAFCPLVGVMYGSYSVQNDSEGVARVRRSGGPASDAGAKRDDFESAITQEVNHASAP